MTALLVAFSLFVVFLILDRINAIYGKRKEEQQEFRQSRLYVLKIVAKKELAQLSGPEAFRRWINPFLEMNGYSDVMIRDFNIENSYDLTCRKNGKVIYGLCKIWDVDCVDQPVERHRAEKLVGAMVGDRVKRGLVITTSELTEEARRYIEMLPASYNISIMDGEVILKTLNNLREKQLEPLLQTR